MILPRRTARAISIVVLTGVTAGRAVAQQQPAPTSKSELVVGRDDFQQLRWIAGRWRVESAGVPAAFERYRFADDSTLVVERFSDNKFRSPSSTVRYELRGHRVTTSGGPVSWILTGLGRTNAAFRTTTGTPTEAIWRQHDDDEWIAVLSWPPTVDQPARMVTYRMKRLRGS